MIRPAIVGWREWVGLPEIQRAPVLAKIDTGAWSNTLHAADIEIIESVPESRIRFKLEEAVSYTHLTLPTICSV